ncbi:type II toxin-antitoxin system VapB family antitoxin [Caulobacter sp. DWR2-3-1b2]|uniref:type II toxin-antitoxin system VapB family antitoxin n=1 Tax=unclassified Caulobacter TaxID=2648921 RepID=UPI0019A07BC8|nr:type II toxin-antitoxin system VapB family antitoxin [Caulobacter sp.]
MALSIKTREADQLARDLAKLTGETMTQAVTVALKERLERETSARTETPEAFVARIRNLVSSWSDVDRRPVTEEEWIEAGGDDRDLTMLAAERAART